ncbi:unnamed protein product [Alopecurus aequalis]
MYLAIPPAYGHPDDGEPRPPFVLMEPYAYFADRDNATTATCEITGYDGTFKLTFCTARAPLVSYMCFHATHYSHTDFGVQPQILAAETDGGLVLLRVVFGKDHSSIMFPHNREYLVYDASVPSLKHLPHPGSFLFSDDSLAFVRKCSHVASHDCSSNCGYVLAAHCGGFLYPEPSELYLSHSDSETWEKKQLVLKKQSSDRVPYHSTCKAITLGGHTVAWVDLWYNIVICDDVLAERPELRSLELPPPIVGYNQGRNGNPRSLRDITLIDGFFKYVQILPGSPIPLGFFEWEVTVWSTRTSSSSAKDWVAEYKLKSTEIPETSLPELRVDLGRPQPTLSTLHIGLPIPSLQDTGIVYLLSKVFHCDNDHVAWVLAVDMRNKTIQKVGEFNAARTLGLAKGYNATSISKFLKGN